MTVTHLVSDTTTALPIHHARGLHCTHALTDPIASLQLGRLGAADLEQFILRLRAKGLSSSTIRQTDTVLRQVLDTAVRDGLLWFPPNRGGFGYAASRSGAAVLVS